MSRLTDRHITIIMGLLGSLFCTEEARRRARLVIGVAFVMIILAAVPRFIAAQSVTGADVQLTAVSVSEQLALMESRGVGVRADLLSGASRFETRALLGLCALQLADTTEARGALQGVVDNPMLANALSVLEGHSDGVRGALELSDGRLLSWSWDGTLRLWDGAGMLLFILGGHSDGVSGALELADGRLLSWSVDGTLRLWDSVGASLSVLEGHSGPAWGAVELVDGRLLSWSLDGTLRLWDGAGASLSVLEGHSDVVWGVLELRDGRLLSWSDDGTLRLWDLHHV